MGRPHLGVSFELRCLQLLSGPGLVTQQCPGWDNWFASGPAAPVLSY